jgi:hypothetical protein
LQIKPVSTPRSDRFDPVANATIPCSVEKERDCIGRKNKGKKGIMALPLTSHYYFERRFEDSGTGSRNSVE